MVVLPAIPVRYREMPESCGLCVVYDRKTGETGSWPTKTRKVVLKILVRAIVTCFVSRLYSPERQEALLSMFPSARAFASTLGVRGRPGAFYFA